MSRKLWLSTVTVVIASLAVFAGSGLAKTAKTAKVGGTMNVDLANDVEAIPAGHLVVEKHDVGPQFTNRVDGGVAIAYHPDDVDVGMLTQQARHSFAAEELVVDDEDAQSLPGCHRARRARTTMRRRT